MMNGKLKKAPHLDVQDKYPHSEVIALAGSLAWNAWGKKGQGVEWDLLREALQADRKYKPIILGPSQLAEISKLQLTAENHRLIRFCIFGELTEPQKSGLLANLAINSHVESVLFCDNLGQEMENLSDYVNRLRNDENDRQNALEHAKQAEIANAPKTSPYIEYREQGEQKGLFFITPKVDNETGNIREDQKWICNHIELVGEGKTESNDYFYIFKWLNPDEKTPQLEAIPLADFGSEAGWKVLKNKGLKTTTKTGLLSNLGDHFHFNGDHSTKWDVTQNTGWHNGAYLLPNGEIIGMPSKPIIFKGKSGAISGYDTKGTLDSWREKIADNVNGNYSMMLALAAAFSSPLLKILKADSFGVHLFNRSSKGKTTALNIANSIYGNPSEIKGTWDTTQAAVNNEANARNDGFITLDELGQARKINEVEAIAYSLFNEVGRNRGAKEGGNQNLNRWKITALSTGEKDVEGFLKAKGFNINAGQLVRLLNVPLIEAEQLHSFDTAKEHADYLNKASKENYGVVGREWIKFLIANHQDVKNIFEQLNQVWQKRLSQDVAAQIRRVATRFAILETALNLAKPLTGWKDEENREALIRSFNDWLTEYGTGDREDTKIIERINDWLAQNAESIFIQIPSNELDKQASRTINGYRILEVKGLEREHFYVFTSAFNDVVSSIEMPKKLVLDTLFKHNMIKTGKEQENRPFQHKPTNRLINQGVRKTRYYVIYPLEED